MRNVSDIVWRIVTGAGVCMIGVFVCSSTISYNISDPSWNTASGGAVQNLFGVFGAVFADLACQLLGWSAFVAGLVLLAGGAMRTVLISRSKGFRWFSGGLSIPLFAMCFAVWPVPNTWPLRVGPGGMVGDALAGLFVTLLGALNVPFARWLCGIFAGILAVTCIVRALGLRRNDARFMLQGVGESGALVIHGAGWLKNGLGFLVRWCLPGRHRKDRAIRRRKDRAIRPPKPSTLVGGVDASSDDTAGKKQADTDHQTASPSAGDGTHAMETDAVVRPVKVSRLNNGRSRRISGLPPIELLYKPGKRSDTINENALREKSARLSEVLHEFGVRGHIHAIRPGPVVTLFELEPAPGIKSARVIALADDVARSMSSVSARIAVVPGKNAIGIELPNDVRQTVYLHTLLSHQSYTRSDAALPMTLGEDIGGIPVVAELATMPHLLIAGTTGSGKSVGVNAMILSLLYKCTPADCRFIFIDPKMLELSIYEGIPHLLSPVVTDPKKAVLALQWAVREMEMRYTLMSKAGVRNLAGFNRKAAALRKKGEPMTRRVQVGFNERGKPDYETENLPLDHIPNIVIVIDEMADLMMVAGKDIEGCVQRLAQMARAAGIHLVTATQRPSVDVITGTIKANFPTRISYMVTTKIDSRTILGEQGAEQLLGMGDLLYQAAGVRTKRCHGPFVSDDEVQAVVGWLHKHGGAPEYNPEILEEREDGTGSPVMDAMLGTPGGGKGEDLYDQAVAVVLRDGRASTSYIQRRLKIGYNRAASLVERMEDENIVSAPNHAGKRTILQQGADGTVS